eukprot:scaffold38731_cov16-Tisochrysis_lutea.AAC.1
MDPLGHFVSAAYLCKHGLGPHTQNKLPLQTWATHPGKTANSIKPWSSFTATTTEEAKDLIRQFRPTQTRRPEQTVAANSVLPERRKERENMADFIAKKREIFLLQYLYTLSTRKSAFDKARKSLSLPSSSLHLGPSQMSLDTKRAEIQKLEERARQREEALKKSEQVRQVEKSAVEM